jgi:hypothetical protein
MARQYPEEEPMRPRARTSPWVWVAGGCAGCGLVVVVLVGLLSFGVFSVARQLGDVLDVGTVDLATVQSNLGPEVPIYPESELSEEATRMLLVSIRTADRLMPPVAGKGGGDGEQTVASFRASGQTADVLAFFDRELTSREWSLDGEQAYDETTIERRYVKGQQGLKLNVGTADAGEVEYSIWKGPKDWWMLELSDQTP